MCIRDRTVSVFYLQNCLHHFSNPIQFFKEMDRVLKPGGGAIILEPYYGVIAEFLYKRLFSTEGFDKNSLSWETVSDGPMNGANQALSYLIFHRDRKIFLEMFQNFEITDQIILTNYIKYLASGGLNFRQILPDVMNGFISAIELCLSPLRSILGLHHITVIRKNVK